MRNPSSRIAFCGLMIALSMVFMLLTYLLNFTYALPAIAGALLVIVVIEISIKYAFVSYAVVALLSVIIVPDKFSVLLYISFFGYYPIIKALFEKVKSNILSWVYKFLSFNVVIAGVYFIATMLLNLQDNKLLSYVKGPFGVGIFLAANVIFFLYDLAVNNVIAFYIKRLQKNVSRVFK